jgi:hypothetical protein
MLVPRTDGFYDPMTEGVPLLEDLTYLLDADSHHHREPCGLWCLRRDVLIAHISDDDGGSDL